MPSINFTSKEINCKIVYYGPAMSGKTTNLLYIHQKLFAEKKSEVLSLATQGDRTLFFDFLPVGGIKVRDYTVRFLLYTVPGQVFYNATRKLVLRGVDGLVFVADAQACRRKENIESLNNLEDNLISYKKNLKSMPLIIQFNKMDLNDLMDVHTMNYDLNRYGNTCYETEAINGKGVIKTLNEIGKLTVTQILENL